MSAWFLNPPAPCAEMVTGHDGRPDTPIDLTGDSPAVPPLYNLTIQLTPAGYLGQPGLLAYPEAAGTFTLQRDHYIAFDQGGGVYSDENRQWRANPDLPPPAGPQDIEEPPYDWFDRLAADQLYRRYFEPRAIWRSTPINLAGLYTYRWQLLRWHAGGRGAHGVAVGSDAAHIDNYPVWQGHGWQLMYGPAYHRDLHPPAGFLQIAPPYLFWSTDTDVHPLRPITFRNPQATWNWLTPGVGGPPGGLHREFWEFPDEITLTPAWW